MVDAVIRRVQADEVVQIRALRLAALADAPDAFLASHAEEAAQPEAFWRDRARRGADGDTVATFVAVHDDRHIGTVTGLLGDGKGPAQLVAMWVEPASRGAGVGRALVDAVCGWAAWRGAAAIELEVREHNGAARRLYERAGFEVAGPPPATSKCELRMARALVSPIVARIQREAGVPELFDTLVGLPGTDLQSLLLEVFRRRSGQRSPAELLAHRRRDPTLPPAPVDVVRLHEFEGQALAAAADAGAAHGFEPVALSPVSPLGLNAVLGSIDQNNALATIRGTEVLADPTTALALEAALRRRAGGDAVRLCSVDRVLRLQSFPEGWAQHFSLFSLLSAGRATAEHGFEIDALRDHVATYLRLLTAVRDGDIVVEVCDPREALVEERVYEPLRRQFPGVAFSFNPDRERARAYYDGLLLEVVVRTATGERLSIADGGLTDWTQRLLSNRKERLFVSGLGLELLLAR